MMCPYCGCNNMFCEHDALACRAMGPGHSRLYYRLYLYKTMYINSKYIYRDFPSWEEYKFQLLWDEIYWDWVRKK